MPALDLGISAEIPPTLTVHTDCRIKPKEKFFRGQLRRAGARFIRKSGRAGWTRFAMDSDHDPGRKRTKPPVIELEATDVTPEPPKSAPEAAGEEKPRDARSANEDAANGRANERTADDRAFAPPSRLLPILSGIIGLLAGALTLALVFLFVRGGPIGEPAGRPATDPALTERVDQLLKLAAEMEKRLAAVESRPNPQQVDLAPLNARIEGMENAVNDLRKLGEQGQAANAAAIEALNNRLSALEQRFAAPPRQAANAAQIVALGALRDAIVTGGPFEKELAGVRALLGDRAAPLAPFEPAAHDGLPSTAKLFARFAELAPKLAREDTPPPAGYFARLWSSAANLVQVRPVGEAQGTSAGAVVARMEERLKRGDLAAALDEGARLPEPAKAAAADWFAAAAQRRDAERAVKNLIDAELAALSVERPR